MRVGPIAHDPEEAEETRATFEQLRARRKLEMVFEKYRPWRSERHRHLRDHAASVLTPAQLEQLDAYAAMNESLPGW